MKFLIWLAVLPSIIIGILIYKADRVEQEPKKELIKASLMGILSVVITVLISLIMFNIIAPESAMAYLDPGTGSMIIQVISATILGVGITFKSLIFKIRNIFKKKND